MGMKKRLVLKSALTVENIPMTLNLWRMTDNTFTAEIETYNCTLSANANTLVELKSFLSKSYKLLENF